MRREWGSGREREDEDLVDPTFWHGLLEQLLAKVEADPDATQRSDEAAAAKAALIRAKARGLPESRPSVGSIEALRAIERGEL